MGERITMTKYKQFAVGNIVIRRDGDALEFSEACSCDEPANVILAILAVGRYLRWHNCEPSNFGGIANVTSSKTGQTKYVNMNKVMHINSNGHVEWCIISKKQLQGIINDWYKNGNDTLIPQNGFSFLKMLTVRKIKPFIYFEDADYLKADQFIESNCKTAGTYEIKRSIFQTETGLISDEFLEYYISKRVGTFSSNKLYITAIISDRKNIYITLR